ncbi:MULTISPECIES: flagellar biosynthesis protein FlhA [unclassified Nocardioides]|uniref:flagellar biosynthesis protein FlhA n=1 Tax=unclassified Nocardioides TaxID=2615069 RepID=UPI00191086A2|nr:MULTISPECIES: flagellar biosynthesis protein FlhA [unclassified Nocardioides]
MKSLTKLGVPLGIVMIVVMLVVPLPAMLLDVLIALNITGALLVLMVAMFIHKPLEFAAFPSVILVMTLFRLALNVSATRLVLVDGYAGKVIDTFGHFVVGGSLIVGLIVFSILLVIQFIVITNGAGRVAEVGARFALDAMPGKQMAIDADLNSGLIDEDEARRRRAEVHAEADFHGAMDGASKFVKGDAVAAIIITLVNLLGGFAIGVAQNGMPFSEAIQTYSLLSIGDGLVSQVPALLLSVATGLIVTRSVADSDMGSDIVGQMFARKMPLRVAGFGALGMCLIPGLPKLPFLLVGGLFLVAASRIDEDAVAAEAAAAAGTATGELVEAPDSPEALAAEIRVDPLGLELSADLIDLVDARAGGDLLDRVKALRRKVAGELGIVIPPVRTRDNLELPPNTYAITLYGAEVARGEAPRGTVLAIGDHLSSLPGMPTQEPVFGLEAKWIPAELRHQAEIGGATVVDRASVVTTHLSEVVHQHASRLLGREDVRLLTDIVKRSHPVVIEELTPVQLPLGEVQRVLRALLDERIPIRDLVRIFEALSIRAAASKDLDGLIEAARASLEPSLASSCVSDGVLHAISFDPVLEQQMLEGLRPTEQGTVIVLHPDVAQSVLLGLVQSAQNAENSGLRPVLVCAPQLRAAVRRLVAPAVDRLPVLAYSELGAARQVRSVGVVGATGAVGAHPALTAAGA